MELNWIATETYRTGNGQQKQYVLPDDMTEWWSDSYYGKTSP